MAGPAVPQDPCWTVTMGQVSLGTACPCCAQHVPVPSTAQGMAPGTAHAHMGVSLWHSVSPSVGSPSLCLCFSNKNRGSSHWHPVPWQPGPSTCPGTLRDPSPRDSRQARSPCHSLAGHRLGAVELGHHEAAVSRHHMSRAARPQLPNKHPLSARELLEPAAPRLRSQHCQHRPGVTRASAGAVPGAREAARHRRTEREPGGYVSPRAAQESGAGCGMEGGAIAAPCPPRCPRAGPGGAAGAMPAPISPTAGPPGRAGGAGGAGWAGTCRGRRGRRGSRGRSRRARPWPWHGAR